MSNKQEHLGIFLRSDQGGISHYAGPFVKGPTNVRNIPFVNSFSGVENPIHKWQIRHGDSATTPASGTEVTVSSVPILFGTFNVAFKTDYNVNWQYFSWIGQPILWLPGTLVNNTVDTTSLNQVTASVNSLFLDRCKAAISSFQSGQDIIEIKQTIESIIHPLASLRKHVETYFLNLKKIKGRYSKIRDPKGRARSLQKALSDTYLEWTFGWNPLAADIAQGVVDLGRTRFTATPVRASRTIRYTGSQITTSSGSASAYIASRLNVTSDYSIRLKGMVNAYYNGTPPTLQQELQLLPEDFAPTAWNVLPYSFVIDYFLNIGDIVNAYSFPSAALKWCNRSRHDTTRMVQTYYYDAARAVSEWPPASFVILGHELSGANNFDVTSTSFIRDQVVAADLIPPLVIKIPGIVEKPWRNIAALIGGSKKLVCPFF
jgi:hypothetical protein